MRKQLLDKINSHSCIIGVIGLGYVGLPLALRLSEVFPRVIGFDTDSAKIDCLHSGKSYIKQISDTRVQSATLNSLKVTDDFSLSAECDALIICVPTPLTKHFEPDLSFVRITIETIQPYLRKGQVISLESTTFPGTTEELIVPRLEKVGLEVGKNIFAIYSPEREDPGNAKYSTQSIPKVLGGHTTACLEVGTSLYSKFIDSVVPVSSTKAAEMTKLLENIHRAVNIGLVNEMKIVADKMGIDIHEVIEAAATKPFGFSKFLPGPGLGGHCIPIDPFYLTWKAKEFGVNTKFIELSGEVNRGMPLWVTQKLADTLNKLQKPINGSRILVVGIAYKKNVDDPRESPAIKIMELLRERGALVSYSDPYISTFPKMRDHHFDLKSIELTAATISNFDAAILATDHDNLDYSILNESNIPILDTRNRLKGDNIVKA